MLIQWVDKSAGDSSFEVVLGDLVGGSHPLLLSPGTGFHSLFRLRAPAVAPTHEGYQRMDHPLVSGITAL